jgi:hypothetical protein
MSEASFSRMTKPREPEPTEFNKSCFLTTDETLVYTARQWGVVFFFSVAHRASAVELGRVRIQRGARHGLARPHTVFNHRGAMSTEKEEEEEDSPVQLGLE